ncbi:MAG: D-alanyl-D-alanine carboxypeptidase [Rhodobacteraceae bacterium]|nr:D-alanyl-D-alanine carboxypeptidase [Paracoccaceae bacterium]
MKILLRLCIALAMLTALPAAALDTPARAAMVVDYDTGIVLLAKNQDEPLPPASMSKLMTLNMVFEALETGRILLTDEFPVSDHAVHFCGGGATTCGSTMYLDTRDRVSVEDLIKGVIVLSGNDASVVLAEGLAGSEAEFAIRMTERARELGMLNSTFANATGWPHPDHRMSARDLVFLARRLIKEFPQYYRYFAIEEFAFDNRVPNNRFNRNPLLGLGIGADGLKTGHTSEAGYGLVGSAVRDGRRVIVMITGMESSAAREAEAERLVTWAFREFTVTTLFTGSAQIARAEVWLGDVETVGLAPIEDISMLLPYSAIQHVTANVIFNGPIAAPIAEGELLGELIITIPDMPTQTFPLVAIASVSEAGFLERYITAFTILKGRILSGDVL